MPVLKKIVVQDFRNIALQELEFSENINCICGNNGEGKTNLMDAIYYLSMTKSAFAAVDKFNFRYGCSSFSLAGTYRMPAGPDTRITMKVEENGEKKVRRDDKPYAKISEHIGVLPVVMVSPSDSAMVSDAGEERRRFMNAVISQMDREYLLALQQYSRLLQHRNRLLKAGPADEALLGAIDAQMARLAAPVYEKRCRFAEELNPVVGSYYQMISGGRETVSIAYRSDLEQGPLDEVLARRRERDAALRFTTAGIQRDDLEFSMNGYPIRKCGSQGQQKSFLVALKFAQYEIMSRRYGFPPILLLDDLFDKLDLGRISNLLKMVAGHDFGQIFLSDCNKTRLSGIVDEITSDRAYFEAVGGGFSVL